MKATISVIAFVSLVAASSAVLGDDATNTSGAPDATVMTQTQDTKAAGTRHGDSTKGGRPTSQSPSQTRP